MTAGTVLTIESHPIGWGRKGRRIARWVSREGPIINLNPIAVAVVIGIESFDGRKIFVIPLKGLAINVHIVLICRKACVANNAVSFQ
jgi:hypothetical protein